MTTTPPTELPSEGDEFGGRFTLERRMGGGGGGVVFRAKDSRTRRTVMIRLLPAGLMETLDMSAIGDHVAKARGLQGRGIARMYGIKAHGEARYVVSEWVQGQPLSELTEARRQSGKPFTAMGAYNIVGNILWALQTAHGAGVHHGDLRPENVFIDKKGRVKVCDFLVSEALAAVRTTPSEPGGPYEVPEADTGPRSDLRNAVLMFAELYSGRVATEAVDALPAALGALVRPWMAPDPADRPDTNPAGLRAELQEAVKASRSSPPPMPSTGPPPPPPENGDSTPPGAAASGVTISSSGMPAPGRSAALFKEVLDKMGAPSGGTSEHWLAQHEGLDYGPFSSQELMDRVRAGEFDEHTQLRDLTTGRMAKLREFPALEEHLAKYFAERTARAAVEKAQHQARVKTARKAGKGFFGLAAVGGTAVAGIIGWLFLHTPHPKPIDYAEVTVSLGGVLQEPTLEAVETLARARHKAVKHRRRKARKRAMLRVVDSYEGAAGGDSVSRVDLSEDASGDQGGRPWDQVAVDRVLAKAQRALGGCVRSELKRNPGVGRVVLSFKVASSGSTKGVRVEGKSTKKLGKCMVKAVGRLKFPPFGGFDRTITLPYDVAR